MIEKIVFEQKKARKIVFTAEATVVQKNVKIL
jgi:hypothetical protein